MQVRRWDKVEFETVAGEVGGVGFTSSSRGGHTQSALVRNSPQIAANPNNQSESQILPQIRDYRAGSTHSHFIFLKKNKTQKFIFGLE